MNPEDAFEEIPFSEAKMFYKWDKFWVMGVLGKLWLQNAGLFLFFLQQKDFFSIFLFRDKNDPHYAERVAIKFQQASCTKGMKQALEEVSLLKFLEHPNIVSLVKALKVLPF